MLRAWKLTKRSQYVAVYESGRTWVNAFIVLKAMPNGLEFSRCGFSVTKNVGNAVMRNRIKRLLKEVTRLMGIQPGYDIVFIARPSLVSADYHQIRISSEKLLRSAHLLIDENEVAGVKVN